MLYDMHPANWVNACSAIGVHWDSNGYDATAIKILCEVVLVVRPLRVLCIYWCTTTQQLGGWSTLNELSPRMQSNSKHKSSFAQSSHISRIQSVCSMSPSGYLFDLASKWVHLLNNPSPAESVAAGVHSYSAIRIQAWDRAITLTMEWFYYKKCTLWEWFRFSLVLMAFFGNML